MQVLKSGMRERKGIFWLFFWLFLDRVLRTAIRMGRISRIFENRFFLLFSTGMAIFICDVCLKKRLISTKYNMKTKMAKIKSWRIYTFIIRIEKKKHWAEFHFRV